jgi:hypothetical protein
MGFSRVSISYRGLGEYMRTSGELRSAFRAHAEVGVRFAKAIAPVGPARDPHRTQFRDSIHIETSFSALDRQAVQIVASPVWAEFGRKRTNRYQGSHTLRRTAQFLNAPKRRA